MTVNTIESSADFDTNGATVNFPFFFKFLANDDLVVTYVDSLGTSTVLALGTHYTVSGAGSEEGGSITTTSALASGKLNVSRDMDTYQQTSLRNQGKFLAETHEDVFDRLTMLIQQSFSWFRRALVRPRGKNYYDAEGRLIKNLGDGAGDQDAVNVRTMRSYVDRAIAGVVGGFGWFIQNMVGAVYRTFQDKMRDGVSVKDFGAIGDGTYHALSERFSTLAAAQAQYPFVTSLAQSIDYAALQAALNAGVTSPFVLKLHGLVLVITDKLIWRGGVFLQGVRGRCSIKLNDGANCTIIESEGFDFWSAYVSGSNVGYTLDGGLDGIILDGNAQYQGSVSNTLADLVYAARIHSHRFHVGWLQIRRVKGIGAHFKYNRNLMDSYRLDGVDDYGFQGDPRGSPSPYDFKQINVIDTLYEAFVFDGPADIPIWHLTTNYCGWLDNSTTPITPRTSLLFPGEEIHSVRIHVPCKIGYLNANGALYGRSLYIGPNVRFHGDTIIPSSSWGAMLVDSSAYGSISSLVLQQNQFSWGGVFKPHLEIKVGTGSSFRKGKFSFPQVTTRRISGGSANNIGPLIYDDAGQQFGIIDGLDSFNVPGHGLVLGPNNVGGIYESVNFDSLIGTASDGTRSAAIMIEAGARDWRIDLVRLTNCDRQVVNKGVVMRGVIRSGTIEVNTGATTGQIALEGVVSSSQLASVIPGSGSIALENIPDWNLEILDNSVRYYRKFRTSGIFDTSVAGPAALAAVDHKMWKTPTAIDCTTGIQYGPSTWPVMSSGFKTLNSSQVALSAFVHTVSTGNATVSGHLE